MFHSFSHLTTLLLVPEYTRVSFHWVIGHVTRSCPKLKEFHLVYDGEQLQASGDRIGDLVQCHNLVSLCLFNYNKNIYWPDECENLKKLLKELRHLKHIYHKDLLLTLLQLDAETTGPLGLERFDLWQKHIRKYWYIHDNYVYITR